MILILHDTPEGYPFVAERMTMPCRKVYSPQKNRKYFTWLAGAWKAVRESKKSDVIISLYDFQGVLCYWIGLLTFRRRNIIAINILLKEKHSLRNKIAEFLYKRALRSRRFRATASTNAFGERLTARLRPRNPILLLPDVFYNSYLEEAQKRQTSNNHYVFSGGRNGRDWNLLIETARLLPDIPFHISLPHNELEKIKSKTPELPQNVSFHCDIPSGQFLDLLAQSAVVALPLDTSAPAGLIVLFQAGACMKPVILTDSISTHDYIADGRGFGVANDPAVWAGTILSLMNNEELSKESASRLNAFIINECNESKYVDKIEKIVSTIE